MRRSQEAGKSTLPQPPHRAHPSRLAWGLPLSCVLSTVSKNAGPRKIFPMFPHAAFVLAKSSVIDGGYAVRHTSRTTAAYLTKPLPGRVWNKSSTFWLSLVTGNLVFKQRN